MTKLKILIVAFVLTCVACKKVVKFDGVVVSRHMVPMANVAVNIAIFHDGSSHGLAPLSGSTDKDGKFNISGKINRNDYGAEVNVHTADSGSVEHQSIINKTSDIQIILN